MSGPGRRGRNTYKILLVTPLIVAGFVFGGLYLGFYLSDAFRIPRFALGLVLSTGGLFASLPVIVKFVGWMVGREGGKESS